MRLLLVIILAIFPPILAFAETPWSAAIHVNSLTIYNGTVLVEFSEKEVVSSIVSQPAYGLWQAKLTDISSDVNKALYTLLITAKLNSSPISISADVKKEGSPSTILDLPNITSIRLM